MQFKYLKYLILLTLFFILQGCTKKAETDEEMREMIIGTWRGGYKTGGLRPDEYLIIEFKENNKYNYAHVYEEGDTISDEYGDWAIDSTYYIEDSRIIFDIESFYSDGISTKVGRNVDVLKLTDNKLIFRETEFEDNDRFKFKKQ